ncbi:hypothetical protein, partial [Thermoleptolyngbya sp.]
TPVQCSASAQPITALHSPLFPDKSIEQDRSLITFWQKVSFLDILSHSSISALSPLKQFRNHTEPRIYKTSFSPDSMTNDSVFLPGEALILVDRQEFRCPLRASPASKTLELNDNTCDRQSIHYHSPL